MINNRIFRVFVMQRNPPEDKNVVWFDSEERLLKIYQNGKWEVYSPNDALLISKQYLTDKQKVQARENINALEDEAGVIDEEHIATGAVTTPKIADRAVTSDKIADYAVIGKKIASGAIKNDKIRAGAVSIDKLNTDLQSKVNDNVKTVEQTLTDAEIGVATKNLKLRDGNDNFFTDLATFHEIADKNDNIYSNIFGIQFLGNKLSSSCGNNIFGNFSGGNTFGNGFQANIVGNLCRENTFGNDCYSNTFGNRCSYNNLGESLYYSKIDNNVQYIDLKSNAFSNRPLKNIHILSDVRGTLTNRLIINIPDKYLNSSRTLIITTKRTDGGPSTPEDIVMYYADEVAPQYLTEDEVANLWDTTK